MPAEHYITRIIMTKLSSALVRVFFCLLFFRLFLIGGFSTRGTGTPEESQKEGTQGLWGIAH